MDSKSVGRRIFVLPAVLAKIDSNNCTTQQGHPVGVGPDVPLHSTKREWTTVVHANFGCNVWAIPVGFVFFPYLDTSVASFVRFDHWSRSASTPVSSRVFSLCIIELFNIMAHTVSSFKSSLKTYLFQKFYWLCVCVGGGRRGEEGGERGGRKRRREREREREN